MDTAIPAKQKISSVILGTFLFIFTELMFFSGIISAFLLARVNQGSWPPEGQERLVIEFTIINSVFLILSGLSLGFGKYKKNVKRYLLLSIIGGLIFFTLQGMEWFRLLKYGLFASESIYAAYFYLIIGAHAVHVLMGISALLYAYFYIQKNGSIEKDKILSINVFWQFVVWLWPVLYYLVYIY